MFHARYSHTPCPVPAARSGGFSLPARDGSSAPSCFRHVLKAAQLAMLLTAAIGALLLATDAAAHGRFHGHHGHRHHGHFSLWLGVPGPAFVHPYPRYYYPYPPTVVVPAPAPPVYIEQPAPGTMPGETAGYWYYCRESRTYYPYVQQCPSPWERVVPHSAPPS